MAHPPDVDIAGTAVVWCGPETVSVGNMGVTVWTAGGATDGHGWTLDVGAWRDRDGDIIGYAARVTVGELWADLTGRATLADAAADAARQADVWLALVMADAERLAKRRARELAKAKRPAA